MPAYTCKSVIKVIKIIQIFNILIQFWKMEYVVIVEMMLHIVQNAINIILMRKHI